MKNILLFIFISIPFLHDFDQLYFGTDDAIDIMTWNIEWFPKNGQVTVEYECDIAVDGIDSDCCLANGDVNEDGVINVVDIVQMVNTILDPDSNPTDYELCLLDLNGDGIVNVVDIVSLVNSILGN